MDEEYREKLQRYREIIDKDLKEADEELEDLEENLLENNSFENPLDRKTAEEIIEKSRQIYLEAEGGWPLWDERSFKVNEQEYTVIAWGASGYGEGKDALQGIVFVKEDEESKKM